MMVDKSKARERFCFWCGDSLGENVYYDRYDTCGKLQCDRAARNEMEADREEAHERLDRDNGWGRY